MKMKRLAAAILSVSALAAAADTTATGSNEIGTLAITSTLKNTVVAVPFTRLGSLDAEPQELVLTANLTEGDQLYIFEDGAYKGYVLGSSGWAGVANASIGSDGLPICIAADGSTTLATGSGFWLVRNSSYVEGTAFTFYIYGEYRSDVTSAITAGAQNLIANPLAVAASPNFSATPADGDAILFPQAGVLPKRYTYSKGKWHCDLEDRLPAFAAGQGAWYISKGFENMTCTWN